ncbi:MAG: MarC family protein [Candidatus Verstraetearchaeota archaeon]|nr:MarC family protein [Candidatus Verstraetearchaeota archaeon]
MTDALGVFLQGFVTLLVIFDPIGNIPLFQTFTATFDVAKKKKVINRSVMIAMAILAFFALGGFIVFEIFNISINDFRIAGGILLFILSIEGLLGREEARWISSEDIAVVPLATPLMAGPGAIYTVIYLMQGPFGPAVTLFAIVSNIIIQWVLLFYSERVLRAIGKTGSTIISRIMAFILSAIAIGMIREGITTIIVGLT